MQEWEAEIPRATMYAHWMQDMYQQAKQRLENRPESMKKYYNRKVTAQPTMEVVDLVMWNAKRIHTKRPSKKLSTKLDGPFKILAKQASRAYKSEISPWWKIHPLQVFQVSLWEPY